MSPEDARIAMCAGKEPFPTHGAALKVLKRKTRPDRRGREAYRCPSCGQWHIGTNPVKGLRRA